MKLLLISLHQQDIEELKRAPTDISALGTRYLSSYLKARGHSVSTLFLPKPYGEEESKADLNQINDLILNLDPDLIGLSLMSNHFLRAKKITIAIKNKFKIPVIWGGIHPTIEPGECLNYADMVCVGEGEIALSELLGKQGLAKKSGNFDIRGIWYKKNGQVINNGHAPLVENIDTLPYPDYNFRNHYIIHGKNLIPLDIEVFKKYYPASRGDHRLIATRGCPYACAYCCNSVFRLMYGGHYLRRRSVENLIAEMLIIKNQFPFIKSFKLMDDSFASTNLDWLEDFSRKYKEEINLPFFCLVSPSIIDKRRIDVLVDCGLRTVQIGLQSGSDRVNKEIYLRNITKNQFLGALKLLEIYWNKLTVIIDVIVDNPYETDKDLLETARVLNQVKRPFNLALYSLAFYPGTELYKKIVKDKIAIDSKEYLVKEFHLFTKKYLNKLIYLIPRLSKERMDKFLNNYQNLSIKIYVEVLFFLFMKKNTLPRWLLKFLSKIKKVIKFASL